MKVSVNRTAAPTSISHEPLFRPCTMTSDLGNKDGYVINHHELHLKIGLQKNLDLNNWKLLLIGLTEDERRKEGVCLRNCVVRYCPLDMD
jgi:hypothetical protein